MDIAWLFQDFRTPRCNMEYEFVIFSGFQQQLNSVLIYSKCSLDPLAQGPLGTRASGSKLILYIKTEGLFGHRDRIRERQFFSLDKRISIFLMEYSQVVGRSTLRKYVRNHTGRRKSAYLGSLLIFDKFVSTYGVLSSISQHFFSAAQLRPICEVFGA